MHDAIKQSHDNFIIFISPPLEIIQYSSHFYKKKYSKTVTVTMSTAPHQQYFVLLHSALGIFICVEIKRFENHGKKTYLTVALTQ